MCRGRGLTPISPQVGGSSLTPLSPPRLELVPIKTEPQVMGRGLGACQSCSPFGGLGWPLAWHGAGSRAGRVAGGGRKRGKPARWKLPCGWLRRPRHTVFIESSQQLSMPHSRINPFQATVPAWWRRTLGWGSDSQIRAPALLPAAWRGSRGGQ